MDERRRRGLVITALPDACPSGDIREWKGR
jgi:hypothetical protein